MIKFEQSQALTSHFESFWSIVIWMHFSLMKSKKIAFTYIFNIFYFFFFQVPCEWKKNEVSQNISMF